MNFYFLSPSAGFSSPNFLHLLPDGFGEGEMFVLDPFHCHHPPITATQFYKIYFITSSVRASQVTYIFCCHFQFLFFRYLLHSKIHLFYYHCHVRTAKGDLQHLAFGLN